jgi:SSS family solute:Na+ symporter
MWKPIDHPNLPWTGIALGAPILGIWYWCTDQYIVQRVLSARSQGQAQTACVFAGYLKILPVFLFVLPGIIAAALYQDVRGAGSDQALPALVMRLLPAGLRGCVVAALLAALMSSLSSIFNSCSTLVTWDFYRQLHPGASERTLVRVGQVATVLLVGLGLLWIPFMKHVSSQLFLYLQSISGYIAPPIAACFLFGLFFPRLNGAGALASLLTGFVLGATRLGLELANGPDQSRLPSGSLWERLAEVNFLHFAAGLFVVCTVVLFVASLLGRRPSAEKLENLTWRTLDRTTAAGEAGSAAADPASLGRRNVNVGLSILLVGIVAALWTIFA